MLERKYNIGDQFVTEISEVLDGSDGTILYRMNDFRTCVFDEIGLSKLDKLDDDYVSENFGLYEDHAYQKGLDDAWKVVQKIIKYENEEMMPIFGLTFGTGTWQRIFLDFSARETIERIEKYESEHHTDQDIQVGDEVTSEMIRVGDEIRNGGVVGIVTHIEKKDDGHLCYHVVGDDGFVWYLNDSVTKSTGRRFPEFATILSKVGKPN